MPQTVQMPRQQRDDLIKKYTPLAEAKARRFAYKHGQQYIDDYTQAAMLGLLVGVEAFWNVAPTHVSTAQEGDVREDNYEVKFLSEIIRSNLFEEMQRFATISIPRRSLYAGAPECVSMEEVELTCVHHFDVIIKEFLSGLDDGDKTFIALRLQGLSVDEIADEMGTSLSTVKRRAAELKLKIKSLSL